VMIFLKKISKTRKYLDEKKYIFGEKLEK
jgi:hypothetical protein